jgi:hypothetical protein
MFAPPDGARWLELQRRKRRRKILWKCKSFPQSRASLRGGGSLYPPHRGQPVRTTIVTRSAATRLWCRSGIEPEAERHARWQERPRKHWARQWRKKILSGENSPPTGKKASWTWWNKLLEHQRKSKFRHHTNEQNATIDLHGNKSVEQAGRKASGRNLVEAMTWTLSAHVQVTPLNQVSWTGGKKVVEQASGGKSRWSDALEDRSETYQ